MDNSDSTTITVEPSSQDLDYSSPFHNPLDNWTKYADQRWTPEPSPEPEHSGMSPSPTHPSPALSWADDEVSPAFTNLSLDHYPSSSLSPAALGSPVSSFASPIEAVFRSISPDPGPNAVVSPAELSCIPLPPPQSPRSTLFGMGSQCMDYDEDDMEDATEHSGAEGDQMSECDEIMDDVISGDYEPSVLTSQPLKLQNWNQTQVASSVSSSSSTFLSPTDGKVTSSTQRARQHNSDSKHPNTKQKGDRDQVTKSSVRGRNTKSRHRTPKECKRRNEGNLTHKMFNEIRKEAERRRPEIPTCLIPQCKAYLAPWKRFPDWERHMKTHLPETSLVCRNCKGKFSRQDALDRHLTGTCNGA